MFCLDNWLLEDIMIHDWSSVIYNMIMYLVSYFEQSVEKSVECIKTQSETDWSGTEQLKISV